MQKIVFVLVGLLAIVGYVYVKRSHAALPDMRADDAHAVHIAMGGHDFSIPRYYLVASSSDDEKLANQFIQHGHAPGHLLVAEFDLVAGLPKFDPVQAVIRDAPYGNAPDDKIRFTVTNQPAPALVTLQDYVIDLDKRRIKYTVVQGPYGLTQEDDAAVKSKVPIHHLFGGLFGRQLMITCTDAPGLSCSFVYPLDQATVTVAFAPSMLPQWTSLYPAAVNFMTGFRRD